MCYDKIRFSIAISFVYANNMGKGNCSICLHSLVDKTQTVITTACGHAYHLNCLHMAIQLCRQEVFCCPLCRKKLQHIQPSRKRHIEEDSNSSSEDSISSSEEESWSELETRCYADELIYPEQKFDNIPQYLWDDCQRQLRLHDSIISNGSDVRIQKCGYCRRIGHNCQSYVFRQAEEISMTNRIVSTSKRKRAIR